MNAAINSFPTGDQDGDLKIMLSAGKEVVDGLKTVMADTQRLYASLDKETFGSKEKSKSGGDGLDKVRKLWKLNLDKLLTDLSKDEKAAESALAKVKAEAKESGMDLSVTRVNAVVA